MDDDDVTTKKPNADSQDTTDQEMMFRIWKQLNIWFVITVLKIN